MSAVPRSVQRKFWRSNTQNGTAATANTGGGGGGAEVEGTGGNGGSGLVIIRYTT